MIHEAMLDKIRAERGRDGFIYPDYGRCSLAELVPTIELMFGIEPDRPILPRDLWARKGKHRRVVMLLLDGFAFHHFRDYHAKYPLLNRLAARGDVFPLTSVFPSTTPAALTTIHTGLTPQEHGLPEWTVFFEEIGAVIETLPFRMLLTHGRDTLLQSGGASEMLYHGRTVYQALKQVDVPSHVFTYTDYAESAYSVATQRGANVIPYTGLLDMMTKLRLSLEQAQNWGYFFAYWGAIDSSMHAFGPYSKQHEAAIEELCWTFENEVLAKLSRTASADTLFLLSADHGHMKVDPSRMTYLDQYGALEEIYQKSQAGPLIPPTGAPQDVFLFVPPESVDTAIALLERELGDKASVMRMKQAVDLGLFGMGRPSERFLRRTGTILILPKKGQHVWYRFNKHEFNQKGTHGGLTEEEMIVPFAIADLDDLRP
jgi:hypothetical protein